MPKKKKRPIWWIVSTHVLTTGFAAPLAGALIGGGMASWLSSKDPTGGWLILLLYLGIMAAAYTLGILYSLSYIRAKTYIERPTRCILPSAITFAVLCALWYAAHWLSGHTGIAWKLILGVYYVGIIWVFFRLSRRGFYQIKREQTDSEG